MVMCVARRFCRLSEASTPPLLAVGGLPENPTLSTKKKKRRGKFKNNSRGGFSGWTRASFAGRGAGAELTLQPSRSNSVRTRL